MTYLPTNGRLTGVGVKDACASKNIKMDEIKLLVLLSSGALQLSKFCLREPQLSDAATAPDNREITLRV